jgi:hypothetical protein
VPVAYKLRETIETSEVESFLKSDYMSATEGDAEKQLDKAVRYALSYKKAVGHITDMALEAHTDASYLEEALFNIRDGTPSLVKDTECTMRVLGGVCQQIKVILLLLKI